MVELVLNEYCQPYLLPMMQTGAIGVIIAGIYTAIVSNGKLPSMLYFISVFFSMFVVVFIYIVLDVASKGTLVSKVVLKSFTKWKIQRENAPLLKKVIKSLYPVKIHMGPFQVVDKGRAPALLRFCLQRTTFLIFKSRST